MDTCKWSSSSCRILFIELKGENEMKEKAQRSIGRTAVVFQDSINKEATTEPLKEPVQSKTVSKEALNNGQEFTLGLDPVFHLTRHGLYKEGSKAKDYLCQALFVSEVVCNSKNNELNLKVTYFYQGKWNVTDWLKPIQITQNKIMELVNVGVDIPQTKAPSISLFLLCQYRKLTPVTSYSTLGWSKWNNEKGQEEIVFLQDNITSQNGEKSGVYIGERFDIQPKGSFKTWSNLIKSEVIGNTAMETAFLLSLSSITIAYFKMIPNAKDISIGLIHYNSPSTSGKGTMLALGLSIFGNPSQNHPKSLLRSHSSTYRALIKLLSDTHGLLIGLDEISATRGDKYEAKSKANLIYDVSNGRDSDRLNSSSELQEASVHSSLFLSTGEESLSDFTNNNQGVQVRTFELKGLVYTSSANQADHIKAICNQNYGFLAKKVSAVLLSTLPNVLEQEFLMWLQKFEKEFSSSNVESRMCRFLAAVMLGTFLVQKSMGIQMNADKVFDLLCQQNRMQLSNMNLAENAYQSLTRHLSSVENYFKSQRNQKTYSKNYGFITDKGNKRYYNINLSSFKIIMSELKFTNEEGIRKKWKELYVNGDCRFQFEKDRLVNRVIVEGKREEVVTLTFDLETEE